MGRRNFRRTFQPLQNACRHNRPDSALSILQKKEASPMYVGKHGWTPLMYACNMKMTEVAFEIIATGEGIPAHISRNQLTALLIALDKNMSDVGMLLIAIEDYPVEQLDKCGNSALTHACRHNDTALIEALLTTGRVDVNLENCYGITPLMYAAKNGNTHCIDLLLAAGADPGRITEPQVINPLNPIKRTALWMALWNYRTDAAIQLVKTDQALPEQSDATGNTPLRAAIISRKKELVIEILKVVWRAALRTAVGKQKSPIELLMDWVGDAITEEMSPRKIAKVLEQWEGESKPPLPITTLVSSTVSTTGVTTQTQSQSLLALVSG